MFKSALTKLTSVLRCKPPKARAQPEQLRKYQQSLQRKREAKAQSKLQKKLSNCFDEDAAFNDETTPSVAAQEPPHNRNQQSSNVHTKKVLKREPQTLVLISTDSKKRQFTLLSESAVARGQLQRFTLQHSAGKKMAEDKQTPDGTIDYCKTRAERELAEAILRYCKLQRGKQPVLKTGEFVQNLQNK